MYILLLFSLIIANPFKPLDKTFLEKDQKQQNLSTTIDKEKKTNNYLKKIDGMEKINVYVIIKNNHHNHL